MKEFLSGLPEEVKASCGLPSGYVKEGGYDLREVDAIFNPKETPPYDGEVPTREEFHKKHGFALVNP